MSDLRPNSTKITLGGTEYGLNFSIKAIDEIQDHYDMPILNIGKIMSDERKQFKNTAHILSILINEDIDCLNEDGGKRHHVDENFTGRHIIPKTYRAAVEKIYEAFNASAPDGERDLADTAQEGDDNDPTKSE